MMRRVLAGILAAAAAVGIWTFSIVPYRCNLAKKRIIRLSAAALAETDATRAAKNAARNLALTQECRRRLPRDIDFIILAAANRRILGDFEGAIGDYRTAVQVEERPELYFELGITQLEAGDRAGAVDSFTRAVLFRPQHIADVTDPEVRAAVVARVFDKR